MVKVYSKNLVKVALASLLVSLGANAMEQSQKVACDSNTLMEQFVTVASGPGQQQGQQSGGYTLIAPKVKCGEDSCYEVENWVAYYQSGDTTIEKIELTKLDFSLRKTLQDNDNSTEYFKPEKRDGGDSCSQQQLMQKGCNVGETTTQVTQFAVADDFHGTVTGQGGILNFKRSRLNLANAFGSEWEQRPVQKISESEFLQHFHGDVKHLSWTKEEIKATGLRLLEAIQSQKVVVVEAGSKMDSCSSAGQVPVSQKGPAQVPSSSAQQSNGRYGKRS